MNDTCTYTVQCNCLQRRHFNSLQSVDLFVYCVGYTVSQKTFVAAWYAETYISFTVFVDHAINEIDEL